jgi:hypothetical protein
MLIKRKVVRGGRTWDVPYKYKALQRNGGGKKSKRKKQKNRERTEKKTQHKRQEKEGTKGKKTNAEGRIPVFPATSAFINLRPRR